jgi:hypothetical protein
VAGAATATAAPQAMRVLMASLVIVLMTPFLSLPAHLRRAVTTIPINARVSRTGHVQAVHRGFIAQKARKYRPFLDRNTKD